MKLKKTILRFISRDMLLKILFSALGMYFLYGTIIFFGTHYTNSMEYRFDAKLYDIAAVFIGADERIQPAFELVQQGKAKSLVFSPASPSEITEYAKKYNEGNVVPFFLETKSTSTHDNAAFCAEIIKRENAHRVILITSCYHMKRSYRLLALALRGYPVEIACYSVFPFGIDDESVMKRIPYFQIMDRVEKMNIFFNYCKFMIDGLRIKGSNSIEHYLEHEYGKIIKNKLKKYDYKKY